MVTPASDSPASDGTASEEATRRPISVFLLDDHEIVRRGVRDMLEAEGDIKVTGEAGTAAAALARIPALRPDVAVLDVRLPDGDGVTVCREIRSLLPDVACLMLTSFADDDALMDAVMAGAAGYVLKQIRGTDLVGAVRTVATGQSMLDPRAASQLMARLRGQTGKKDPLAGLTPRRSASSNSSARGSPTGKSASSCSWPRRQSRTTSPASSPNSAWNAAPRPPPTPPASSARNRPVVPPGGARRPPGG